MQSFAHLLDVMNAATAEEKPAIRELIKRSFQVRAAALVLDMTGFSISVRRTGVLAHLALIRRMQVLAQAAVQEAGGQVVKFDADNVFAVFETAAAAIDAAERIQSTLEPEGLKTVDGYAIGASIGIDCGDLLLIRNADFFGDPVNVASKLGEDIAGRGEVLVTDQAYAEAGRPAGYAAVNYNVSGLPISAWRRCYDFTAT